MKITAPYRTNWFDPVFTDLNIFLLLPFSVKLVLPEQAKYRVGLMVFPIVRALERMGAQFPFLHFEIRRVYFFICFAAPSEFAMVFQFVGTIIFDAFGPLISRSLTVDFIFSFLFILFLFLFFSLYSIFKTTRVRVYLSCCYISHKLMVKVTRLITRLEGIK